MRIPAKNALLTGLPRSGTTMICHLLNRLPNVVALHEPMEPVSLAGSSNGQIVAGLRAFFDAQRDSILSRGQARSKSFGGNVPTNPLSDVIVGGQRQRLLDGMSLLVSNVTSETFSLYLKHPAFFTACLPFLSDQFQCYASVRNPLSVLLSWQNAEMPVKDGHVPAAEHFDPALRKSLAAEPDRVERQIIILEYFYRMYSTYIPDHTMRYEDIIATNGRFLAIVEPSAIRFDEPLQSRNKLNLPNRDQVEFLLSRLVNREHVYEQFYSRDDVLSLVS